VFLANHSGVHMHKNVLAVLSLQHQIIHLLQIKESGALMDLQRIGPYCFEDDELHLQDTACNYLSDSAQTDTRPLIGTMEICFSLVFFNTFLFHKCLNGPLSPARFARSHRPTFPRCSETRLLTPSCRAPPFPRRPSLAPLSNCPGRCSHSTGTTSQRSHCSNSLWWQRPHTSWRRPRHRREDSRQLNSSHRHPQARSVSACPPLTCSTAAFAERQPQGPSRTAARWSN